MVMLKNVYSLEQIEKARNKEKVILRWQAGEKLKNLMKDAKVSLGRSNWWVLKKKYAKEGFLGLLDKRGGSVPKIDLEIRDCIRQAKQDQPYMKRKTLSDLIAERYGCTISLIHLSRILKEEGIYQKRGGQRKEKIYDKKKGIPVDCAGSWFLKGADSDMKGIETITEIILKKREKYLSKKEEPWWRILKSKPETIIRKNESLLYLPVFGMTKPYHLNKYHKSAGIRDDKTLPFE